MDIASLKQRLNSLDEDIKQLLKDTGYLREADLFLDDYNKADPEHSFILDEARKVFSRLDDVHSALEYLNSPIEAQGVLTLKDNGRYAIGDKELSCGSALEVLVYDSWDEKEKWTYTTMEHNGDSYYLTGLRDTDPSGIQARKRG